MKKMTFFISVFIFILTLSCSKKQNLDVSNKYILNGNLEGFKNNTWIYLLHSDNSKDSTLITQGKFNFEGEITEPKEYNLFIKNSKNYVRIWLESGKITFNAKNGTFNNALVSGSKSQKESEQINTLLKAYRKRRDSLTNIVRYSNINDSIKITIENQLQIIHSTYLDIEKNFIKNNPNSYISAYLLDFYTFTLTKTDTRKLYNNLSENIKNSSYGKGIKRYLTLNKTLKIGDKYVDFISKNEKNELIKLSNFEGKLILLDFWASWCAPCKEEFPILKKVYTKYKDNNFEIVSISQDRSKNDWLFSVNENHLNWINLWEKGGTKSDVHIIYDISGIPYNFLIDKKGIIIARDLHDEKLISAIEKAIGEEQYK
jgi:thiol-disulfide isomerase/thioredoxin